MKNIIKKLKKIEKKYFEIPKREDFDSMLWHAAEIKKTFMRAYKARKFYINEDNLSQAKKIDNALQRAFNKVVDAGNELEDLITKAEKDGM